MRDCRSQKEFIFLRPKRKSLHTVSLIDRQNCSILFFCISFDILCLFTCVKWSFKQVYRVIREQFEVTLALNLKIKSNVQSKVAFRFLFQICFKVDLIESISKLVKTERVQKFDRRQGFLFIKCQLDIVQIQFTFYLNAILQRTNDFSCFYQFCDQN